MSVISSAPAAVAVERLTGHGGPVKAVTISADGQQALTASFDYSIILWALDNGQGEILHRMIGHDAAVNDVAFVPGQAIAVSVSDDGSTGFWNLDEGTLITRVNDTGDKVMDVAITADGRFAAIARWDGTARVLEIATHKETARLEGQRGNVNAIAFDEVGDALFSASYDGTIMRHGLANGRATGVRQVIHDHGWGINTIALAPDGKSLAFGSLNGTVGLIRLDDFTMTVLEQGEHPILSLAYSAADNLLAAGGADGRIRLYDLETNAVSDAFKEAFGPVWSLAFAPGGKHLYRAGLDDYVIGWQFDPRQAFEAVQSQFPRRFSRNDVEDPGEIEFLRKCSVCHTLTPDGANRAGPTLYGLFGRVAGSVEDYAYSDALLRSGIVWDHETISRLFDDGPDVLTPGTKMPIQRLKSVERRDALIGYLEVSTMPDGQTPPPGIVKPVPSRMEKQ
jgi:cytochrome c